MERRSNCPISFALDLFGDRWTLLVVRDLALKGKRSFSELRDSDERVATNILTERLARLEEAGLVLKERDPDDGRRYIYRITEAGKDLLPVLVEIIVWSYNHGGDTGVPASFIRSAKKDRTALIRRLRSALD